MFYFVTRFPFVSSPAKAEAYRKHIDCYLEFEGKEIICYLRVPHAEPKG